MRRGAAAALLGVALVPALALAQVYRWEDQRGTVHYTNTPDRVPDPQRARPVPPPLPTAPVKIGEMPPAAVSPSVAITRIPYTPGVPILVRASIGGAGALTLILDTGADRTM